MTLVVVVNLMFPPPKQTYRMLVRLPLLTPGPLVVTIALNWHPSSGVGTDLLH